MGIERARSWFMGDLPGTPMDMDIEMQNEDLEGPRSGASAIPNL